jgi:MFS family permease
VKVESLVQAGSSFLAELRDGWSAFVEHTWMWVLVLWIALYFMITYAPFFVLGPYIAKHSMGGAGTWGVVVTGEGIGALLGGLLGLRLRTKRPLVATGLLFLPTTVQSILLAFHAPVELLAPAAALAGFAFSCGSVVWDTVVQRMIPPDKLARVAAYGWMGAMVFLPAGYALAGPISSLVGMRAYLLFGAGWVIASTLVVVRLRSVRELTLDQPVETAPLAAPA